MSLDKIYKIKFKPILYFPINYLSFNFFSLFSSLFYFSGSKKSLKLSCIIKQEKNIILLSFHFP